MGTNTNSAARTMDAVRHLVRTLANASRAVQARSGISGAQLFILRQLATAAGPLSVTELAQLTLTHQSTVSGVVTRLVARRLVTRTPAPEDARRVAVALTARGRALLVDAPPTPQTQLVSGLARLAPAQCAALADGLEAWLHAAGLGGEPAPLFFESEVEVEVEAEELARGGRRPGATRTRGTTAAASPARPGAPRRTTRSARDA